MDNQRLILSMALAFVLLLIWQQWQADYAPVPSAASAATAGATPSAEPAVPGGSAADVPRDVSAPAVPTGDREPVPAQATAGFAGTIKVRTDNYAAEIGLDGGNLRRVDMLNYPVSIDEPDHPFRIYDDTAARTYIAQTGLIATEGTAPNHYAVFAAPREEFAMAPGQDELRVPLTWQDDAGHKVVKTYVFKRGSYLVNVEYEIINASGSTWNIREYRQFQRSRPPSENQHQFVYTYTGGAIYSPEDKFEKIKFDDMDDAVLAKNITGGWAAMLEHYFVSAWIPPAEQAQGYYTKALGDGRYVLGIMSAPRAIEPAGRAVMSTGLFIGPKVKRDLDKVAEGLHLTIDYGWLTVISEPLFWGLDHIHSLVGNWGLAIIILTILIKAAFYKLSEASYRSMANMRKLTPKLQALKEKFGDDKQKLNQAMMEMYRKEKINPLGGCLPMVVQIPVFIALYWALLESVELRQAPFIFWIRDLSQMDPYYVLPVIMGITMLIQQKLNPAPVDPIQAKIMMALPLVFTVFFAFFPSGLVVYWIVNNVLSIAQQWHITRKIEAGAKA